MRTLRVINEYIYASGSVISKFKDYNFSLISAYTCLWLKKMFPGRLFCRLIINITSQHGVRYHVTIGLVTRFATECAYKVAFEDIKVHAEIK